MALRRPVWPPVAWLLPLAALGLIASASAQFTVQVLIEPTIDASRVQAAVVTLSGPGSDPMMKWPTGERFRDGFIDGSKGLVRFNRPLGIASGPGGVYVADSRNHAIRQVFDSGSTKTIAGGRGAGFADGLGENAKFFNPCGIAVGPIGEIYVADTGNNAIRRIYRGRVTTLYRGVTGYGVESGSEVLSAGAESRAVHVNGLAAATSPPPTSYTYGDPTSFGEPSTPPPPPPPPLPDERPQGLWNPQGVAVWPQSAHGDVVLLVADTDNHRVVALTPPRGCVAESPFCIHSEWSASLFAGSGSAGFADGMGPAAQFRYPKGIALCPFEGQYQLLVADSGNNAIRVATMPSSTVYDFDQFLGPPPPSPPPPPVSSPPPPPPPPPVAEVFCLPLFTVNGTFLNLTVAYANLYALRAAAQRGNRTVQAALLSEIAAAGPRGARFTFVNGTELFRLNFCTNGTGTVCTNVNGRPVCTLLPRPNVTVVPPMRPPSLPPPPPPPPEPFPPPPPPPASVGTVHTLSGDGAPGDLDSRTRREKPRASLLLVTRLAARFALPSGVACDAGYGGAIVADYANHRIRQVNREGLTVTVAGYRAEGESDGRGAGARFRGPAAITRHAGKYLVVEAENADIRLVALQEGELREGQASSTTSVDVGMITGNIIWPLLLIGLLAYAYLRYAAWKKARWEL